jgi:hypothetical protein
LADGLALHVLPPLVSFEGVNAFGGKGDTAFGGSCLGRQWSEAPTAGFPLEVEADEVGERVGGDAAGVAEGDRDELAAGEQVIDGGAAELEAGKPWWAPALSWGQRSGSCGGVLRVGCMKVGEEGGADAVQSRRRSGATVSRQAQP